MAEIRFSEQDGVVRVQVGPSVARVQGEGSFELAGPNFPPSTFAVKGISRGMTLFKRVVIWLTVALLAIAIGFVAWRWWSGGALPPILSIGADIVNVALIGSLLSLGGVSLMSIEGQVASGLEAVARIEQRCPFEDITVSGLNGPGRHFHALRPGNPQFCVKCPLGIDTTGDRQAGFLIHGCAVYKEHHRSWLDTPPGMSYLADETR